MMKVPSFEGTLRDVAPIIPFIYTAFDHGAFQACEFFDNQAEEENRIIEPYLASMLARYYAVRELRKLGQDAKEEVLNLDNVPNIGVYLHYGKYHIRILKSDGGEVPIPGSMKREQFYGQQPWLLPQISEDEEGVNLLILWDTHSRYSLNNLYIACPKQGGRSRESIEYFWSERIPETYLFGIQSESISQGEEVQGDLQRTFKSDIDEETKAKAKEGIK